MVKIMTRKLHDIHISVPINKILQGHIQAQASMAPRGAIHLLPWPWTEKVC